MGVLFCPHPLISLAVYTSSFHFFPFCLTHQPLFTCLYTLLLPFVSQVLSHTSLTQPHCPGPPSVTLAGSVHTVDVGPVFGVSFSQHRRLKHSAILLMSLFLLVCIRVYFLLPLLPPPCRAPITINNLSIPTTFLTMVHSLFMCMVPYRPSL